MIRYVARIFLAFTGMWAIFWACYYLQVVLGGDPNEAVLYSVFPSGVWAIVLARWAAMPPRPDLRGLFAAPMSTSEPTTTNAKDWR